MKLNKEIENRGVSEVLGSILLFGLLVIALVLIQTNAVPSANEAVEFDHSQAVQQDLLGLEAELSDAAATGRGGTQLVTLGTDYPNRFLLRNPPPVAGTLSTEPSGFTLANARAVDNPETADYWDGSARAYDSRRVVYRVDYNVYDGAPTTVLAHGAVYDRFPNGRTLRIDERGLIDGRTIDIAALQGRRNGSRVGPVSVSVSAPSAPTRTVRVTNTDAPLTLTLRTEASATEWRAFLADQFVAEGGHVQAVRPGGPGAVEVVLEPGVTYDLRLASVAIGTGATDPGPHYMTAVTDSPAATAGSPTELTVEVRDRFNGPVAGTEVAFSTTSGTLSSGTATTGDEGRATVQFTPASAGTATVTASADLDGSGTVEARERVTFEVAVSAGGGGGSGGGGGAGVGQGGTETYSPTSPTRTLSTKGGLWTQVTGVPRLLLSNPRFAPNEAGHHEELRTDDRFLRTILGVETGTTTYYIAVTETPEGLSYEPSSGAWSNTNVRIIREQGTTTATASAALDPTALTAWRTTPNQPLDLLSYGSYTTGSSAQFRSYLTEIRQALRNDRSSIYIADQHGRVDLTPSPTGRSLAYPDRFTDGDGSAELQESAAIPPSPTAGDIKDFVRMQQPTGDTATLTTANSRLAVGTATYGVRRTGTSYALELRYSYAKGGTAPNQRAQERRGNRPRKAPGGGTAPPQRVEVRIVDGQGTVLQTATLDGTRTLTEQRITLDQDARSYVQNTGNLYVVYAFGPPPRTSIELDIDYQRVRVTD